MKSFNANFYTANYDQEMLDFIKDNFDIDCCHGWSVGEGNLTYHEGDNDFYLSITPLGVELTKGQFKQKIGMPLENTTTVKEENTMENNTFTKSDLRAGMFIKCRNGEIHIVIGDIACDNRGYLDLKEEYNDVMLDIISEEGDTEYDIMEVFVKDSDLPLRDYLSGEGLKSLWKRPPEKTPVQIELEEKIKTTKEMLDYLERQLKENS